MSEQITLPFLKNAPVFLDEDEEKDYVPIIETAPVVPRLKSMPNFSGKPPIFNPEVGVQDEDTPPDYILQLQNVLDEYKDTPITKETVLGDKRLMSVVRYNLRKRMGSPTESGLKDVARASYRVASNIAGGSTGLVASDVDSMTDEEAFESWQEHQRSFAGGQTVTTANELVYGMNTDEQTKAAMGAGYLLFDSMANIFSGDVTWKEKGDAILDYAQAGIWDPATIFSFGLGKVIGTATTKASTTAFRVGAKKAVQSMMAKGMSKRAAIKATGGAIKASPFIASEALINSVADVAYQKTKIETDAQEEYSALQTGVQALAVTAMPLAFGVAGVTRAATTSGPLKKTALNLDWVDKELKKLPDFNTAKKSDVERAYALMKSRLPMEEIIDTFDDTFGRIVGDPSKIRVWDVQKSEFIPATAGKLTNAQAREAFTRTFLFGEGDVKGYYVALKEAGFSAHPIMTKDHKITGVVGETIKWVDDKIIYKQMKAFEKANGVKLNIGYTSEDLANEFMSGISIGAKSMQQASWLSRLEKMGLKDDEALMKFLRGEADEAAIKDPKMRQFALSTYKRLLTSTWATTGANLKGFGQLTSLNAAADVLVGTGELAFGALSKVVGRDPAKADLLFKKGLFDITSPIYRARNAMDPEQSIKVGEWYMRQFPEVEKALMREVSGAGGAVTPLEQMNIIPGRSMKETAAGGIDKFTEAVQASAGVRLQDKMTKTWALGNNVDVYIMREYGMKPQEFFSRPDSILEVASDRFRDRVLDKAINRTLRETASLQWSTLTAKQNKTVARSMAQFLETLTNKTEIGYVVPFGSFLNTTLATAGDLSGVNFIRGQLMRVTGKTADYATQDGAELLAKGVVGWSAVIAGVPAALERLEKGYAWNQNEREDGSVADETFTWPESVLRLTSQILAHMTKDGQFNPESYSDVPAELWEEFRNTPSDLRREALLQTGGQALRDFDDVIKSIEGSFTALMNGEELDAWKELAPVLSQPVSGVTRFMDPYNQLWGVMTDGNLTPDRRQGSVFLNNALRYVDQITGWEEQMEKRAYPTEGIRKTTDLGKQLLGERTSPRLTLSAKVLNSAGMTAWNNIRFEGPPEVKNKMDELVVGYLDANARRMLTENPNFFTDKKLTTEKRQKMVKSQVIDPAVTAVKDLVKGGYLPPEYDLLRQASGLKKKDLSKVKDFLGVEKSLVELAQTEEGLATLSKLIYLTKNYDKIFMKEFNLD